MTDMEGKYFQMVKAIGAIEQRISFYLEQFNNLNTTFSSGSKSGYLSTTFASGSSGYQAQAIFVSIGNQTFSKYQILVDAVSPGPGVDEETKGLLGTIIGWLTSIRDTIGSVFTAIVELPGKIAIAFIDGLKYLFIPK